MSALAMDHSESNLQSIFNKKVTDNSTTRHSDNSTQAKIVISVEFANTKSSAVTKEHADPHKIATGTATRADGPKNLKGELGEPVDVRYPLNPLVVCMLAAKTQLQLAHVFIIRNYYT
ncbi:hypothetical protein FQA39_LY00726 [Lamprigera yunnana]|nr:hypothetical protein FQA39_LY00726 [Lamprigera yunnana]